MKIEFGLGGKTLELTAIVKGDLDGDGKVNLIDTTKAAKYIATDEESTFKTEAEKIAFDSNLDRKFRLDDLRRIRASYANDDTRKFDQ